MSDTPPTAVPPTDPEEWDEDYDNDFDEEEDFDCHMYPDGQCGAAGSEMCDFECPVMARIHIERRADSRAAREDKRQMKLPGMEPLA